MGYGGLEGRGKAREGRGEGAFGVEFAFGPSGFRRCSWRCGFRCWRCGIREGWILLSRGRGGTFWCVLGMLVAVSEEAWRYCPKTSC